MTNKSIIGIKRKLVGLISGLAAAATIVATGLTVHAESAYGNTAFDALYYAYSNPQIAVAAGNNAEALLNYYMLIGRTQGMYAYAPAESSTLKKMSDGGMFDPVFYAATYPDVKAYFGTDENKLYSHYLMAGMREGRLPYARAYQNLAQANLAMYNGKAMCAYNDGKVACQVVGNAPICYDHYVQYVAAAHKNSNANLQVQNPDVYKTYQEAIAAAEGNMDAVGHHCENCGKYAFGYDYNVGKWVCKDCETQLYAYRQMIAHYQR